MQTPAITVDLVLGGRSLTEPRLDPSGARVAYVVGGADGPQLVVVDLDDAEYTETVVAARRVDADGVVLDAGPVSGRGTGGGAFDWLPDGSGLIFVGGEGALWTVVGGQRRRVWPESVDAATHEVGPAVSPDGLHVVFTVDTRDVVVARLDGTGEVSRFTGPDFAMDPAWSPDGSTIVFQGWSVPNMAWDHSARFVIDPWSGRLLDVVDPGADAALQQPGFLPDGTPVDIRDSTGWLTVWAGDEPLVPESFEHAGATWGPRQRTWAASPDGRFVAYCRNEEGFGRLCVADRTTGTVLEVGRGVHAQLSWRGRRLAALRGGARTPTQVVVYDVSGIHHDEHDQRVARVVVATGPDPAWGLSDLGEPELVTTSAADGTTLYARRYAAPTPRGDGASSHAKRLLVWVHGGPTGQWDVSFIPGVAYWAEQGWDVLVVDPRGSTGHGRQFQQALHGRWGELDTDDVAALARHAHAQGWGAPDTTAIMGGSSGGLTVLAVLGRHPGLCAAGVALYPVSDLADLLVNSHRFELHYPLTLVGAYDTESDRAHYAALSPLTYAQQITSPLLILHGTADEVVPVAQSEWLADRIRAAGGAVELHLFDGEGHGFRRPASKRAEYVVIERFLARQIARAERPTDSLQR